MQGRSRCAGASKAAGQCARAPSTGTAVCQGPYCNVLVRWLETASREHLQRRLPVMCQRPTANATAACSGPAQLSVPATFVRCADTRSPLLQCARSFKRKRPVCCGGPACVLQLPTVLPRRSASVLAYNEPGPMCHELRPNVPRPSAVRIQCAGAFGPSAQCATPRGHRPPCPF